MCRPVCKKHSIQQGELNIILFLANNPDKNTAVDIHKSGGMKQSMVSLYVDRLVEGGYLTRQTIPEDRRKVKLVCTEKAQPIIDDGQAAQKQFTQRISEGITREDIETMARIKSIVDQNIMDCREAMMKGEIK